MPKEYNGRNFRSRRQRRLIRHRLPSSPAQSYVSTRPFLWIWHGQSR